MRKILLIIIFFASHCFGQTEVDKFNAENSEILEEKITKVSIIQLIATPEKYEGKIVEVQGFLKLETEGNAIYLHQEDYENFNWRNGVQLLITGENSIRLRNECDEKNVHLIGKFQLMLYTEPGIFSGFITARRIYVNDNKRKLKHSR